MTSVASIYMTYKRNLGRPNDGGVPPGSTLGAVDVAIVVGICSGSLGVRIFPAAEGAVKACLQWQAGLPESLLSDLW